MKTSDLDYDLPDPLIARHPAPERDGARLLVVHADALEHRMVSELPELVPHGALVVVNDTRVRRARVLGSREPGGGKVELFLLGPSAGQLPDGRERWLALGRANKPLREGTRVRGPEMEVEVLGRAADGTLELAVAGTAPVEELLERVGRVPIPPYLGRRDEPEDAERYQTVYARRTSSVAAPTAGLHLSPVLLERLRRRDIRIASLELGVGLGTFRPVTADDLDRHTMHSEPFEVSEALAREVAAARERRAPVVAVGTTVVRALESAAADGPGQVRAQRATTALLIQPGYEFRVVDALLTNFHQPRSTLLALVAAFIGYDVMMAAYAEAVAQRYRFLSYGDAMWIPAGGRGGSPR